MKLKSLTLIILMMVLLISLTACDTAEDNLAAIEDTGKLIISTNSSKIEKAIKDSKEVGIQSVAEERFNNYKIVVTIEHKETEETKSQEKNVNYEENASFSFKDITPGYWEVQATLEADYTGETGHVLETGEDLNNVKIAESNTVAVEVKENETTTDNSLTLTLVQGELALKIGNAPDTSYQLNEIRLLDNDDQVVKIDDSISFGDEIDSWYSELSSNTHHLEVDWAIGDSNQQQDHLLIPIPALTQKVEVDFYNGEAYIMVGWDMPPAVPKNLAGTLEEVAVGEFNVNLNWDGVVNAEKYIIERKVDNDPWEQLAELTNTEYIDSAIENEKVYQYAVIAEDATGRTSDRSQPTEEISIPEMVVFEIRNIDIDPDPVGQGGKLEIVATIDNTANYETNQEIVLNIDFAAGGVVEERKNLTLGAYEPGTVSFNITVPANADTGKTTATVSSEHDSSDQSFYLEMQRITFVEESNLNGVTIIIEDSNGEVAEIETGSYASGKAVEYLESGDYNYTAIIDSREYAGDFEVAAVDKIESFTMNFGGGKGTEAKPYLIKNWNHLDNMRDYGVEDGSNYEAGTYFALGNNLDSSIPGYNQLAAASANSDKGWDPIGDENTAFTGVFDGQGNVISDLVIERTEFNDNFIALFALVEGSGAKIQNLGLENIDITGRDQVAGLAAKIDNSVTVDNCYISDSDITSFGGIEAGGLIGYAGKNVIIKNSHTDVTITGNSQIGGLVGITTEDGSSGVIIENCYALGDVTGENIGIGGLVGTARSGEINDSYAKGNVSWIGDIGYRYKAGGLVGEKRLYMDINNSYAEGDVSGQYEIGGLVGSNWAGEINNSYALGKVENSDEGENLDDQNLKSIGGLIGSNAEGTIKNSYALSPVINNISGSKVGGLIGRIESGGIVENCYAAGLVTDNSSAEDIGGLIARNNNGQANSSYYDSDTTGQSSSDGGTDKTTAEMMQQATFDNWDFNSTWTIDEENSYPSLQWQDD